MTQIKANKMQKPETARYCATVSGFCFCVARGVCRGSGPLLEVVEERGYAGEGLLWRVFYLDGKLYLCLGHTAQVFY